MLIYDSDRHTMAVRDDLSFIDGLEPAFWQMFINIAKREGITLTQIVTDIDRLRGIHSRTSAIRCYVLKYVSHQSTSASACNHRLAGYDGAYGGRNLGFSDNL